MAKTESADTAYQHLKKTDPEVLLSHDISIWMDEYDDIFSDFDSRLYPERNISDDFLYELKRICLENAGLVRTLKLLVPEGKRNLENEQIISKRLHAEFKKQYTASYESAKSARRRGALFIVFAACLMTGASSLASLRSNNFFLHVLLVILEPAGWFLMWTGFDHLLSTTGNRMPDLEFYKKMYKSKLVFISIESNPAAPAKTQTGTGPLSPQI